MEIIWQPEKIENESMQIIEKFIEGHGYQPVDKDVVKRIIHTTGDPAIAKSIKFQTGAAIDGLKALRKSANVFTDVTMLKAGVNKKKLAGYGGEVICSIGDPRVLEAAQDWNITRAASAMRLFGPQLNAAVVAIGNAPTALFELLDLIEKDIARPALIIATPVGFVGAAESKEMLIETNYPYITVRGTRGGSPLAAAAINALLYYEGEAIRGKEEVG
ncbi:cobalt-precorrin-8x methylmutase [hydrocarbon metagenome]|uniref:Cobalt-precorrin-8x methylmutase n=1 Tax=hydrocarbon metagenome TaxID=938273 RepID=A0A0W8EA94_9ZZZZ